MLDFIRIVLVNTTEPGNIGAAARAMKTMGLKQLCLVSPKSFPHPKASAMASGAEDVLANALVFENLEEAIAPCALVLGTSARQRHIDWPLLTPRQIPEVIQSHITSSAPTALVFGQERSGLSNEQLQKCHYHIIIPANKDYASLNLAAAVQIICYELKMGFDSFSKSSKTIKTPESSPASAHQMELFFEHLDKTLYEIEFHHSSQPTLLMSRLRRLFLRAQLDVQELNILRGILSAILKNRDSQ